MLTDKLYLRLLGVFAVVIALSQMGMFGYFLSPRPPKPKRSPATFKIRHVSAPTFNYGYPVSGRNGVTWHEVEISEKAGRQLLALLRGSTSWEAELEDYYRGNSQKRIPFRQLLPELLSRLDVYENGSDMPTHSIVFRQSWIIETGSQPKLTDVYVVLPENRDELAKALAEASARPLRQE